MKYEAKKIIKNVRVIILLIFLVLAIVAINPRPGAEGVAIRSIITDSVAAESGLQRPSPNAKPISRERILEINNRPINSVEDYYNFVNTLKINQSVMTLT